MFLKIAAVIVAIGVVAGALLSLRQLRLQAVHELASVQRRVAEHDRTLWHLRVEIAARTTPAKTDAMARTLGPLEPLPATGSELRRRVIGVAAASEAGGGDVGAGPGGGGR